MINQGGTGRQISPHPRYRPRRRSMAPALAAAAACVVLVLGVGALLFVAHPWSTGGTGGAGASSSPSEGGASATATDVSPSATVTDVSPSASATDVSPTPTPAVSPSPDAGRTFSIYTVRPGDTISSIAARFGISRSLLLAANPRITNANKIVVGQTIYIPWPGWTAPTPGP